MGQTWEEFKKDLIDAANIKLEEMRKEVFRLTDRIDELEKENLDCVKSYTEIIDKQDKEIEQLKTSQS